MPIRLVIHGASGRMGSRLRTLADHDVRFEIVAAIGREPPSNAVWEADVIVDFSVDVGARQAVDLARRRGAALLVGTTGLSAETLDVIDDLARLQPVLVAPNTSMGVAVLRHLVAEAARLLGERFDVDVVEQHHRHKRDAPSGTAVALVDALHAGGLHLPADRVHCIRAGGIVGDHLVQFAGPGESVRLQHSAITRDVFAAGALEAAAWLSGRPPGRYSIDQVLGLRPPEGRS